MVNKLIDGLSLKLNQFFGDGFSIYSEETEQGFQRPCFFITILSPSQKNLIGNRSLRQYPFDIRYYPTIQGNNNELQSTASSLYEALEYVQLIDDDLIRGTKMYHEVVDGILHFYVNFDMVVTKVVPVEEKMSELHHGTNVEG